MSGVPKEFKKQMYESYCKNMKMYGKEKEIKPYKVWLKSVNDVKFK